MNAPPANALNGGEYSGLEQQLQTPPKNQQPKALRFVTNYGAPHPKRRRIAAACLTCMYMGVALLEYIASF